ncbi:MAG: hypothetical protein B6D65_04200 [candidate division Zixibacteria bacterium 4484_93]|nr:MAG: hypothetical protein B6D65_04200 [candidate division Zixibacteria bacterium 4484_93]
MVANVRIKKGGKMKRVLLISVLFLFFLAGCAGEKSLTGNIVAQGTRLSYAPSIGDTLLYKSSSDIVTEFSEKGYNKRIHRKSDSWTRFTTERLNDDGSISFRVFFDKSEGSVIEGGSMKPDTSQNELIGDYLAIVVDSSGQMLDWNGLDNVGMDESGVDRGEAIANGYATYQIEYFPARNLKIGDTWQKVVNTNTTTRDGVATNKTVKNYTLKDFVEYGGHRCAKIETKVAITVTGSGTTEQEGEIYSYEVAGTGDGKGMLYFDFEKGCVVKNNISWMIEFTIDQTNESTGEHQQVTYYEEDRTKTELLE